jgi:hypothetical protein
MFYEGCPVRDGKALSEMVRLKTREEGGKGAGTGYIWRLSAVWFAGKWLGGSRPPVTPITLFLTHNLGNK